jgi:hypothetical protein
MLNAENEKESPMKSNQLKSLRVMVAVTLVLLAIQYELGMVINLSPDLPELPAFGFSLLKISDALHLAGPTAWAHAGLGSILALLSILTLILSIRSRIRSVQLFGSLRFLAVVSVVAGGVLFTLSGFQEDHFSLTMASDFILAFIFYFLELLFHQTGFQKAAVNLFQPTADIEPYR